MRSWLAARLAEAGHAVGWAGPPEELERQPGSPEVLVIGVPVESSALESFRGVWPEVPVVAWVEPGRPVPQLTAPFEWASSADGGALLVAVERAVPFVNLRRERDAARAESAAARQEAELHRRVAALLRDPDAEGFHELLLGELVRAAGTSSGALWLGDDAGRFVLRATMGRLPREAYAELLAPDPEARALLSAGRPWEVVGPGLWVPLVARGEGLALAQLSDAAGGLSPEALEATTALAGVGAAALLSARRFRALQRLALRDPDSSAYNLAYFTDVATKEVDKARRYGRGFSLLSFALDGLPHLRARAGPEQARAVVRATTRALGRVLRESDVLAKVAEQEFLLLLPETDAFGAQVFLRRALAAAREAPELRAVEGAALLQLTGGAASFPRDGEDLDFLTESCRGRLEQRRASLYRRLVLDPVGFWEAVELLLGSPDGPRLPAEEGADPSRRGRVPEELLEEVQAEIGRTLLREPGVRSLVYLGGAEAGAGLPLVRTLERAPQDFAPRVYLLARRAEVTPRPGLTPLVLGGDERLLRHQFVLWLHGPTAYALLQRRGRGATWAFHSSDTALVDGLVSKLQTAYDLQPY
ncbi:MAG TPA: GGDEF domain-containing protein [Myxococcaceae bacterium]|nr:GGDEF domain-containing protein [Myxococcaceae bacterium]